MKKIFLLFTILFIAVNTFAQTKSFNQNITDLMFAKNGMGGIENSASKLSTEMTGNKKVAFLNKMNTLKTEFMKNTISQFKKDYTNEEIVAIYTEFHSDIINRSDLHNDFFSKYRRIKGLYFKSAKELYFQYR